MLVDVVTIDGYKLKVQVPDNAPESTWQYGIRVGPPDLSSLGLSDEMTKRLSNELFVRGLITERDVQRKSQDVFGALQAALKVDIATIQTLYSEARNGNR